MAEDPRLSDNQIGDWLHEKHAEAERMTGETVQGETVLKVVRAVLEKLQAGLVKAGEEGDEALDPVRGPIRDDD